MPEVKTKSGGQFDLHLHTARSHVRSIVERGNRLFERKPIRDQQFYIDFPGAHQFQRPGEHVRVSKNGLDMRLLRLRRHDVKSHGPDRHANEYHTTPRAKWFENSLDRTLIAAGFEDDICSPVIR